MDFQCIPAGSSLPSCVNAVIEIAAQEEPVKYEADKQLGALRVDRIMSAGMRYPHNYGFIPQTLSRDGDPLDILVITPFPIRSMSIIACRPVALMYMSDQAGPDEKVIAVPDDIVCPATVSVRSLEDLGQPMLEQIRFFFEHYKALEPGKWSSFEGWGDTNEAHDVILKAARAYALHT